MRVEMKIEKRYSEWLIAVFLITASVASGQGEKKFIREGNGKYSNDKYPESEILYRKAIDKNKASADAGFNLGDALYKQKKYEDAGKQFLDNSTATSDPAKKSNSYYNLGNSLLNANKVEESIKAYINSLKLNPANSAAKYNLAYAQDLLKKQQQQKQDQDKKNDQDKKDKDKKQDQEKNQQNQDKKQNSNPDQNKEQQQQQGISKEDAQRLLNAIANDEKNVQEKVKQAKAAKEKVRTVINW
jgi:Ca-activated chloride channel family protein